MQEANASCIIIYRGTNQILITICFRPIVIILMIASIKKNAKVNDTDLLALVSLQNEYVTNLQRKSPSLRRQMEAHPR